MRTRIVGVEGRTDTHSDSRFKARVRCKKIVGEISAGRDAENENEVQIMQREK